MKNFFIKLKKMLLYAGLEKDEYAVARELYIEPNGKLLNVFSMLVAVIMAGYAIFTLYDSSLVASRYIYILTCAFSLAVYFYNKLSAGKAPEKTLVLVNIYMAVVFIMGMMNGTVNDPDRLSLFFIVLIVAVPLIFNERPLASLCLTFAACVAFIIMAVHYKPYEVYVVDIINVCAFAVVSFILCIFASNSKARDFLNQWKVRKAKSEIDEQFTILRSMSEIYYSVHLVDLTNDTLIEVAARNQVKQIADHTEGAALMMSQVISSVVDPEYVTEALKFTDLKTVPERMKNKKIITKEILGRNVGWFQAMFIVFAADEDGIPQKVIFSTRVIDEEKKEKEKLLYESHTDELTGLYNRRVYEEDIFKNGSSLSNTDLTYVSMDVNGLKLVNDTKGHAAGDELIVGAAQCMKKVFGPYGKLYRIGGDEFAAIVFANNEKMKTISADFDRAMAEWSGNLTDELTVSYGCASKAELPNSTVAKLSDIAEKRMYEAKSMHYRTTGLDRRGQNDAHKVLCGLYAKILKINLDDDTYQVINAASDDDIRNYDSYGVLSTRLKGFGKDGYVYKDDVDYYLEHTDLEHIKEHFAQTEEPYIIFYRRKYQNGYKRTMMEIVPSDDFSDANRYYYLYVRNMG